MSGYYNRNNRGITKKLGPVTAYADAVLAGYKGTREQWAQDMAKLGQNVTQVAQNTELTTELAEQTRENTEQVAKDTADVRRLADETSDNAVQVASNTAESNRLAKETKQAAAQAKADAEYAGAAADNFRVDTTLSEEGKAAEAKTVGEKFAQLSEEIVAVEEKAEDRLNAYINGVTLEWTAGNISSDGVITDGATQENNYYSSVIPKELIERVTLNLTSWRYGSYCLYQNGVFVSRAAWLDKTELKQVKKYVIDNQCDVRLLIATNPAYMTYDANARIGLTAEEVLEGFEITIDEKTAKSEFEKSNKKITFLDKIMCCDFGGKLMHFSIDDVYTCLYDLATGSYSSIFDQRLFKALKGVHDATGACFTLNCFNTCTLNVDFNLANVPSTWQAEFQANKSWLRFAFHGEDDNSAYATTTGAKDSYERFVNSIYNITGDYGCIDRITRLGFFSGSLENVLALKNANYGIIGLLTADDERSSYYFDEMQNSLVLRKGKYYDLENELVFIRSIPRIDNRISSAIKGIIESNLCYQKTTELFIHENGFDTDGTLSGYMGTITSIAEWANDNGYKHGFACDIYE